MPDRFICARCGLTFAACRQRCLCGALLSVVPLPTGCVPRRKVKSALELSGEEAQGEPIAGFEFLGCLPRKWMAMVFGPPGSGKSTFTLKLFSALAARHPERVVLHWSFEEGWSESLKYKLRTFAVENENVFFSVADAFPEFLVELETFHPVAVAIDSVNEAALTGRDVLYLKRHARCPVLFVCHETKEGKYKGESDLGHKTDINIRFYEGGKFVMTKNRWGVTGKKISFFDPEEGAAGEGSERS